jgi:hypothetical protein
MNRFFKEFFMKIWKHFIFVALFAVIGISVAGADEPSESGSDVFVGIGRWALEEDGKIWVELEIKTNTYIVYCYGWNGNSRYLDYKIEGSYTHKGNTATWTDTFDDETETGTWIVSGNTLIERFDDEDDEAIYTRK